MRSLSSGKVGGNRLDNALGQRLLCKTPQSRFAFGRNEPGFVRIRPDRFAGVVGNDKAGVFPLELGAGVFKNVFRFGRKARTVKRRKVPCG